MSVVSELGYLGLSVSDLDAWKDYAGTMVGMQVVDEGEGDRIYLRMDRWHHRITLHKGDVDDLAYMGWRVANKGDFDALQTNLQQADIPFRVATAQEAEERRVLGLLKLEDPGGNPIELFYSPQVDKWNPFHPGRPMFGRFVTGNGGLGHCIIRNDDPEAAIRFYELLGFRGGIEYKLPMPDGSIGDLYFMSANERQHSVAFGLPGMEKRINHLMIEYSDMDDVGRAHDIVHERAIPIAMKLGKHSNDEALTFYCANPSGWLWELGWKGRETPSQEEHYRRDVWGHGVGAAGYGTDTDVGGY